MIHIFARYFYSIVAKELKINVLIYLKSNSQTIQTKGTAQNTLDEQPISNACVSFEDLAATNCQVVYRLRLLFSISMWVWDVVRMCVGKRLILIDWMYSCKYCQRTNIIAIIYSNGVKASMACHNFSTFFQKLSMIVSISSSSRTFHSIWEFHTVGKCAKETFPLFRLNPFSIYAKRVCSSNPFYLKKKIEPFCLLRSSHFRYHTSCDRLNWYGCYDIDIVFGVFVFFEFSNVALSLVAFWMMHECLINYHQ